jgi:hypothetical protein
LQIEVRIRLEPGYFCYHNPQANLGENMYQLFLKADGVDVAFNMKGEWIFAHKLILKAQAA